MPHASTHTRDSALASDSESGQPSKCTPKYRDLIRPDCVIMHPLPRVNELPDEWEEHPGFVVWRQVRNGMHGADEEIRARARRLELLP